MTAVKTDQIRTELHHALGIPASEIRLEVQDEGAFLLVSVELGRYVDSAESSKILGKAALVLIEYMKPRPNEYSWMVNLCNRGQIIDSESGGWLKR